MKRFILCLSLLLAINVAQSVAQTTAKYGTISYQTLLREMPEYTLMQGRLTTLREAYQSEMQYNEQTFERLFADYLDGQSTFAPSILSKRQRDLQEALEKALAFRAEADSLLKAAEAEMLKPLRERLDSVIYEVGTERGYEYIIDLDLGIFPFIHRSVSEDAMPYIRQRLNARRE